MQYAEFDCDALLGVWHFPAVCSWVDGRTGLTFSPRWRMINFNL